MRHLVIALVVTYWCVNGSDSLAQQTDLIPPRFQAIAKSAHFKLTRILGTPEIRMSSGAEFSADGKLAVYVEDLADYDDKAKPLQLRSRLVIWDVDAKTLLREIELPGKQVDLHLSANGKTALIASTVVPGKKWLVDLCFSVMDLDTGKEVRSLVTIDIRASSFTADFALAPDGAAALTLLSGGVKRWDVKTGKMTTVYEEGSSSVVRIAYLDDGKRFLASYADGEMRLFEVDKKKHVKSFPAEKDKVGYRFVVARDGKRFATTNSRSFIRLWDVSAGKKLGTLLLGQDKTKVEEYMRGAVLADDGKTVVSVWGKANSDPDDIAGAKLIAWDGEANKTLWTKDVSYRGAVPMLVRGDKLLVGGGPHRFDVWSIKDGKLLESWGGHKSAVSAVLADSKARLYSAGLDGYVHVWEKGQLVRSIPAHAEPIVAMTLHPKETHLFTASADKTVKIWDVITGKLQQTLSGHTGSVSAIVVGKDGNRAYTASNDRSIKIWDLGTGKALATLTGHADVVNAIALSPDESWLATGSDDTNIRVWPIKNDKLDPDREAILLEQHKKAVTCLAFAPDGKTLLSGSQDNTVKVWDWSKGKVSRTLMGHKNWITSLAFLDASTLMTTSDDLSLCRWNLETGKEKGRIDFGVIGDCPRCLARLGPDRFVVGTSSWMLFEFDTRSGLIGLTPDS